METAMESHEISNVKKSTNPNDSKLKLANGS